MFNLSFFELMIFGIIALVVLGPEKLPHAVRTAGTYYAKLRRTIGTIKAEMEAELDLAETRQQMEAELAKIRQAEIDMQKQMAELRGSMKQFEQQQNSQLKPDSQAPAIQDTLAQNAQQSSHDADNEQNEKQQFTADCELTEGFGTGTKPWAYRWFLLGAYDKARRLPPAPFMPDYKAMPLLNSSKTVSNQTTTDAKVSS